MRYGTFLSKYKIRHTKISYNDLTPKPDSEDAKSLRPGRIKVSLRYALGLLRPYLQTRFMEQVKAVVPLALYATLFQIFVLQYIL